ncbi:putative choline transporter, neither null mutation nor overexpression affects choline transport, partial [Massospora cicadina]
LLKDICHMTVSGAFAADYFFPSTTSAASKFTSFSSLGRALTTSFGSACFGSLIVAILQLLKALANEARQNSDNFVLSFLACCAECILGMPLFYVYLSLAQIEAMVEYFNRYAYCYCAMYGLPYLEAGKVKTSVDLC